MGTANLLRDVAHHHGWRWIPVSSNTDLFSRGFVNILVYYDKLGRVAVVDRAARLEDSFHHLAKSDSGKTDRVIEWLTRHSMQRKDQ